MTEFFLYVSDRDTWRARLLNYVDKHATQIVKRWRGACSDS